MIIQKLQIPPRWDCSWRLFFAPHVNESTCWTKYSKEDFFSNVKNPIAGVLSLVRSPGLEPGTSSLSVTRSNHLSYDRIIFWIWDLVIIRWVCLGDIRTVLTNPSAIACVYRKIVSIYWIKINHQTLFLPPHCVTLAKAESYHYFFQKNTRRWRACIINIQNG